MVEQVVSSPLAEQEICVKCGLCCDGTLFSKADLQAGEQGNLPEEIEKKYTKQDGKEFFALPCSYFCGQCTIYGQKRAVICSAYRCQLLKDFSNGKMTQAEAKKIVDNALALKGEIYSLYRQVFGREYPLSFREMMVELEDLPLSDTAALTEILKLKCTIYETLLIKNFKSLENFERMVNSSMNN